MIADIALVLSIINSLMWVLLIVGIKRLYAKLLPMLTMMGIGQIQNLTKSTVSDTIREPPKLVDGKTDR